MSLIPPFCVNLGKDLLPLCQPYPPAAVPFEDLFNEVLLLTVNHTAAVSVSCVRSPVFEGVEVRAEYQELHQGVLLGLRMCVQITERFIRRVPGLISGLFWFTQRDAPPRVPLTFTCTSHTWRSHVVSQSG